MCSNGDGATGFSCNNPNDDICSACNAGYYLSTGSCLLNQCTCSSGDGATGSSCATHNEATCSSCDSGYVLTSNMFCKVQYLMYTMKESQTIYSYTLDVDQDPMKNGQFTIPFSTKFPGLVFNVQLNSLEVIGDWYNGSNKNHRMMSTAGSFSDASNSLFNGDLQFEVCYSQNAGTLVFSGYTHRGATQVYIITQNSNWNKIESSDNYLSSFPNPNQILPNFGYFGFGVVEQDDKIYLIGGSIGTTGRFLIHGALCYYRKFPSDV